MTPSKRKTLAISIMSIVLFPVILTVLSSFIKLSALNNHLASLRISFSLNQYLKLLYYNNVFVDRLVNSLIVTITTVLIGTIISMVVSYSLIYRHKGLRKYLIPLVLMLALIPSQIALHPQFWLLSSMKLTGQLLSLIIINSINPLIIILMTILLLRSDVSSIEAAMIDGAGDFTILSHIIIPTNKFFLCLIMSFYFVDVWNQVEQPLLFLDEFSEYPLSVLLFNLVKQLPNEAYAASTLYMIPTMILFMFGIEFFMKIEGEENEI